MSNGQRLRYPELAPEGVAAMRAVERYANTETGLAPVLLELVRLRCSLLNGCEYCVALHTHELKKHHEPQGRVSGVVDWRVSDAFTQAERAALRWAEAVTNIQEGHASDEEFAAVREHFAEVELVDLTLAIASINAFNRMAIAFRPQWHGQDGGEPQERNEQGEESHVSEARHGAPASLGSDDGGKVSVDE